jgi:hypothetical protein
MVELEPAAADPGMVLAAHVERGVCGDGVAGLGDLALAGEDQRRP